MFSYKITINNIKKLSYAKKVNIMTYRHYNCIYCEYLGNNTCKCLKKNKTFDNIDWTHNHCEDLILKPQLLLSHMFKNHDPNLSWEDADKLSEKYLTNYGFAGMTFE